VLRKRLNLGILAHVDAGKTTLTERLLYSVGVIDAVGSVDRGTTQTDTLALERQRGITIKSAVVSFAIGDVTVNLIDTPGHPDFIAEVERVLSVLDGAVLVISAVEGVQPQTRVLMRALERLHIPTLLFVNKLDRAGADDVRVFAEIRERLTPAVVAMGSAARLGSREASFAPFGAEDDEFRVRLVEVLAERDEQLLAAFVRDEHVPYERLRAGLAAQTGKALVHPVFAGSAVTGAGAEAVAAGIAELLPAATGTPDGPVSGTVFKIERGKTGEKLAYARMFAGTLRVRDRVRVGEGEGGNKVTAIDLFDHGTAGQAQSVSAGEIAKLRGLVDVRIGDAIGDEHRVPLRHRFAPPTLESVVAPDDPAEGAALRVALAQLAEQDPLIDVRQDDERHELSVSLYGEVQKEVIQATLSDDYGLAVTFRETTPIYVERPAATGEAIEILHAEGNPFAATIGFRIEPGPADSGVEFRLDVPHQGIPLYVYKRKADFGEAMRRYVCAATSEGLHGWRVTDCRVTMTKSVYQSPDGPPSRNGPLSSPADFRDLTPIVFMEALKTAGSVVCEPMSAVRLEVPTATVGALLPAIARLGGNVPAPVPCGELSTLETVLSADRVQELQRQLPGLTGGEGVLDSDFAGYRPVTGEPPVRQRLTANPLNRAEYLARLARRL
jgi:ribosomal protection tetracycline resistance protein